MISTKADYVLPKHLDEKIARLHLAKIGVVPDELRTAQAEYFGISKDGHSSLILSLLIKRQFTIASLTLPMQATLII